MAAQAPIFPKKQQNRRAGQKAATMPVEEQIRLRAFEIYMQRGSQAGSEIEDWLQAEAEINGQGPRT